jgi:hypothetical protein
MEVSCEYCGKGNLTKVIEAYFEGEISAYYVDKMKNGHVKNRKQKVKPHYYCPGPEEHVSSECYRSAKANKHGLWIDADLSDID